MPMVDQELCIGCGICYDMCPEVFTMTEEGKAQAVKTECAVHNLEEVANACPTEAINI